MMATCARCGREVIVGAGVCSACGAPPAAPPPAAPAYGPPPPGGPAYGPPQYGRPPYGPPPQSASGSGNRTALIIILAVGIPALLLVLGIVAAIVIPVFLVNTNADKANESAVKSGVRNIQAGIESYAVDNNGSYPESAIVSPSGLGQYVGEWPANPYENGPMTQGTGPGQFTYETDGTSYSMVGYGNDGEAVITSP